MTMTRTFVLVLASMAVFSTAIAQTAPPPAGQAAPGAGRQRGQGGQRGGQRGGGGMYGLLARSEVQTELKITDDQKQKVADAQKAMMAQFRPGGQGTPPDPAARKKMQDEYGATMKGILSAEQIARLKQIYVQQQGVRAILDEDVQKGLGLSSDQISKIKTLQTNQQKANEDIRAKQTAGTLDQATMRATNQKNNQIMTDELGKILTDAQKSKLTAMGGTPFSLPPRQGGRRGGAAGN